MSLEYLSFVITLIYESKDDLKNIVRGINIDDSFKHVYYRDRHNFICVNPPDKIPTNIYCNICGSVGPDFHDINCKDPIHNLYYTINKAIEVSNNPNNPFFYVKGSDLYLKSDDTVIVRGLNKRNMNEPLSIPFEYKNPSEYNILNKIVIKHCTTPTKCNIITLTNNTLVIMANPANNPEFYREVIEHVGINDNSVTSRHIKSIFCNLSFGDYEIFTDEVINYMITNSKKSMYGHYVNINKNNRRILKTKRIVNDIIIANFTIQFYISTVQITLSEFLDGSYSVSEQLERGKLLCKELADYIKYIVENNNFYNLKENKLVLEYNTISGLLPYAKSALLTTNGIRKNVLNSKAYLYDTHSSEWSTKLYKIIGMTTDRKIILEDPETKRNINVDENMIRLDIEGRGNKVCRDLYLGVPHHPIPYSFEGICPRYDQIISPIGTQSKDDNHYYPCCKESSSIEHITKYILYGISDEDRNNNLIPDKGPDMFSGVYKQGLFEGPFEVSGITDNSFSSDSSDNSDNSEYSYVTLVGHIPKAKNKFVVQDMNGIKHNIHFSQIHPKYLENRNYIGLYNIFSNKKQVTEFLIDSFVSNGYIRNTFINVLKPSNISVEIPKTRYITTEDKPFLEHIKSKNSENIKIVPKYSILCNVISKNNKILIVDESGITCELCELSRDFTNDFSDINITGFYVDKIIYIVSSNIDSYNYDDVLYELSNKTDIRFVNSWPFTDIYTKFKKDHLREYNNKTKVAIVYDNIIVQAYVITNYIDTTVFLKLNNSLIKVLNRLNKDLIDQKIIIDPKYKKGMYVKITMDMSDLFKIVDQMKISESDYLLFGGPNQKDKLNFILNYFNFYNLYDYI